MREISMRDVGPIEHLEIPIPEGGGVVVLRGVNGSGKSHALGAVQSLMGNGRPASRDGSLGATIEGIGARLAIARRASRSGEVEIPHLEGEDPSLLVDPGLKSDEAADAERIRALCRLARVELDPIESFAPLVGGEEQLREICREASLQQRDVPSMASSVKRDIEAHARKSEQEAKNLGARADGVLRTLEDMVKQYGIDPAEPPMDSRDARAQHENAVRRLSEAEGAKYVADRLFRASTEASLALQSMGDRGTEEAQQAAACVQSEAEETLREFQEALRKAQQNVLDAQAAVERANEAHTAQLQARSQRKQLERAIAEADGVTPVSAEDLAELRKTVDETREVMESASIVDRSAGLRKEAERLQAQARSADLLASELRMAASGTEKVVTEAVSRVCPDDMRIHEGRLMVSTSSRGLIPFSELSEGERWRRAIGIAVAAVGPGGLLVCNQASWEGLDPKNRAAIAQHARELQTVILTAECDEGELRAEVQ